MTFAQIVQRIVAEFDRNKGKKEKEPGIYQGDSCCGGGPMETPEQIIQRLVPRLNETIYEILSEPPFKGEVSLVTGSGEPIFIKPEMFITSITAFTLRVLE